MAHVFDEDRLRFAFDDSWNVERYDAHADYRGRIGRLVGTKAIDLVGLRGTLGGVLYLIEIKDFRGYRIQNKRRMKDGDLANEVAQKVRDTIAGVVGAARTSSDPDRWRLFARACAGASQPIRVVVWLEQDEPRTPTERRYARDNVLLRQFKQKLSWLTPNVLIANLPSRAELPGLAVSNVAP